MNKRMLSIVAVAACLGAAAPAAAADDEPTEPVLRRGFYGRVSGGLGFSSYTGSANDVNASLNGPAIEFAADAGAVVVENFAIFARGAANVVVSPSVSLGDADLQTERATLALRTLAIGGAYYIMPLRLVVSGGGGLTWAVLDIDDPDSPLVVENDTGAGFYGFVSVMKEFEIEREWSFGIGVQGHYASIPDKGITYDNLGASLLLSVTYHR